MSPAKQALLVLSALAAVALVENLPVTPWSPWMILYGGLAIVLPFFLRRPPDLGFLRPRSYAIAGLWTLVWLGAFYALATLNSRAYADYLAASRQVGNPQFDYSAAQGQVVQSAASKAGMSVSEFLRLVPLGTLVWAPIAEEVLYRGYGYISLSKSGFLAASSVSTLYFALRHAVQLSSLPVFAYIPILVWLVQVVPFGFFASHLVHKTGSIYPAMLLHFLVNLLSYLNLWP